ncbi:hypothetical protein HU723_10130 [Pseudomonas lurida]|uniref:hypothetical protein n=1 Tax=Pseudomonas lurida TaxID=244566 RepID=UPI001648816A|nr:hypothetical protein [Pseudomonas lurida]MBC3239537.1 hypothetical protein [Pseudomonas lurida]
MQEGELSVRGKAWRDSTLRCLQESIVPSLPFDSGQACNCEAIESKAFVSHVACYTQPTNSMCDLPLSDWLNIANAADLPGGIFSTKISKQMIDVMRICAREPATGSMLPAVLSLASSVLKFELEEVSLSEVEPTADGYMVAGATGKYFVIASRDEKLAYVFLDNGVGDVVLVSRLDSQNGKLVVNGITRRGVAYGALMVKDAQGDTRVSPSLWRPNGQIQLLKFENHARGEIIGSDGDMRFVGRLQHDTDMPYMNRGFMWADTNLNLSPDAGETRFVPPLNPASWGGAELRTVNILGMASGVAFLNKVPTAFMWKDGNILPISPSHGLPNPQSMNVLGQVVGQFETGTPTKARKLDPVIWEGDIQKVLPHSDVNLSSATCINDYGLIMGWVLGADKSRKAVAWSSNGSSTVVSDLNALLPPDAGWEISGTARGNCSPLVFSVTKKGGGNGFAIVRPSFN